jgi:hypothetical protein
MHDSPADGFSGHADAAGPPAATPFARSHVDGHALRVGPGERREVVGGERPGCLPWRVAVLAVGDTRDGGGSQQRGE